MEVLGFMLSWIAVAACGSCCSADPNISKNSCLLNSLPSSTAPSRRRCAGGRSRLRINCNSSGFNTNASGKRISESAKLSAGVGGVSPAGTGVSSSSGRPVLEL
jgi:hypothetical protein